VGAWGSAHPWWLLPGVIGAFLTSIYVLRVVRQIFWGAKSTDPHFQNLPDAQGTEWVALVFLVAVLILFGVVPQLIVGPIDTATVPLLVRLGVMR
jgi:NADH-quinone oxidoreductase subunit M